MSKITNRSPPKAKTALLWGGKEEVASPGVKKKERKTKLRSRRAIRRSNYIGPSSKRGGWILFDESVRLRRGSKEKCTPPRASPADNRIGTAGVLLMAKSHKNFHTRKKNKRGRNSQTLGI